MIIAHYSGRFGLVRTFRYPLSDEQWGFPRGFAHGENLHETARAELMEELGLEAESFTVLGFLTPDSGLLASKVAIVWAELASNVGVPRDSVEVGAVRWITEDEMSDQIAQGNMEDGFTLSAWSVSERRRQVARNEPRVIK